MLKSQNPDENIFAVHHLRNFFFNLDKDEFESESYLMIDEVNSSGILSELIKVLITRVDDNPLIVYFYYLFNFS